MVDWVLLESTRGRILAAFTCSLSADAPCLDWQEKRVVLITIIMHSPCFSMVDGHVKHACVACIVNVKDNNGHGQEIS